MSSNTTPSVEMSAHGKKHNHAETVAYQPETQSAIPGLSDDVVLCHVLGRIKDPTDLAILRAVSRAMRDAVAATGHRVKMATWEHATRFGYLSTLKHRHQQGRLELSEYLLQLAAETGQLEVVKWLRANGCPWDEMTCSWAAQGGRLEVLQWLRANGCPWNERTCARAAWGGHLEVLQWARANGCPWDTTTCSCAALRGHLEVLQWARANGCPWDATTCLHAKVGGNIELLNWAIANGCPTHPAVLP
tara:strand:+ start:1525 stop:2265 length:741 start_codon:yes stop_codon:yes gene_type:complete